MRDRVGFDDNVRVEFPQALRERWLQWLSSERSMSDIDDIEKAAQSGDWVEAERLLPRVYDELRKLAAVYLAREHSPNVPNPTSLVHEAYLRLIGMDAGAVWRNEGHFFGAAAIAIRRILVENARRRRSLKRGGDLRHQQLEGAVDVSLPEPAEDLLALDEALTRLELVDPNAAKLVELIYFSGLTRKQAAGVLKISPRSADRLWAYAKAWLGREIRSDEENS